MADELGALQADLIRAAGALPGKLRGTVFKGGMETKKRAINLAPKHLGTDNIHFEMEQDADSNTAVVETRGVGGSIFEFGTPTLPGGRPFMLPALRPEGPVLEESVDQIIEDLLW